ncbi:MAG: TatD family hydrolase [bacterium]
MNLIDSHAHVNFAVYSDDYDEVLRRSLSQGVRVVNVGTQYTTSNRAVKYAHQFEGVWAAVGTHPVHLKKGSFDYSDSDELDSTEIQTIGEDFDYVKYLELAKDSKVVAIGEIGLDYHHFEDGDDIKGLKDRQKEVLIEFIQLANEVDKPVMIHCWDGYPDLLEILTEHPVNKKGVIHSFIGGYKTANKFIELGYKIGLNGMITYSDTYHRLIREIDLSHIILETDCPYLAPVPHKGERNEPALVFEVAKTIAAVKDIAIELVAESTTINTERLFNISK